MKLLNAVFMTLILSQPTHALDCNGKHVVGRVEAVNLPEKNITLDAKLDTGADVSSLSATDIKIANKDHKDWVTFTLTNKHKQSVVLSAPLVGYSHVLKRQDEHISIMPSYSTRPEVMLTVCIGNQRGSIKVNLIDRTQFRYGLLVGADALKQMHIMVDVAQAHVTTPDCANA